MKTKTTKYSIAGALGCRPYEPGLHADGSELTGLLQEDRQQRTTSDAPVTGQLLSHWHKHICLQLLTSISVELFMYAFTHATCVWPACYTKPILLSWHPADLILT